MQANIWRYFPDNEFIGVFDMSLRQSTYWLFRTSVSGLKIGLQSGQLIIQLLFTNVDTSNFWMCPQKQKELRLLCFEDH